MKKRRIAKVAGLLLSLAAAFPALAGSHLWRIAEIYSNADGTIQFIELREIGGSSNETRLAGRWFITDNHNYIFPNDLVGDTAYRSFLMGTETYAAQPGVPAPDYVVPDNFFNPLGDTMVWFTYDLFEVVGSEVPADGVYSLIRSSLAQAINTPVNFAGEAGRVLDPAADFDADGVFDPQDNCLLAANAPQRDTDADGYGNRCDADLDNDGVVNFADVGAMKTVFFSAEADADLNGDGRVNFADLGILKESVFGAPGPSGLLP